MRKFILFLLMAVCLTGCGQKAKPSDDTDRKAADKAIEVSEDDVDEKDEADVSDVTGSKDEADVSNKADETTSQKAIKDLVEYAKEPEYGVKYKTITLQSRSDTKPSFDVDITASDGYYLKLLESMWYDSDTICVYDSEDDLKFNIVAESMMKYAHDKWQEHNEYVMDIDGFEAGLKPVESGHNVYSKNAYVVLAEEPWVYDGNETVCYPSLEILFEFDDSTVENLGRYITMFGISNYVPVEID